MIRVCHISSVHQAYDTRIFLKECQSLAKAGYDVTLVAQHDKAETINGVRIIPLKRRMKGRLTRMLFFTWRVFWAGLKTRSKVYHFHDPELVPAGLALKLLGKKVVFDVHENVGRQIRSKDYLPLNGLISRLYGIIDWLSAKLFFIILAEDSYVPIYSKNTENYQTVLNMPDFDFLVPFQNADRGYDGKIQMFYVGGVTFARGIETIVNSLALLKEKGLDFHFHCVGPCEEGVMTRINALPNYAKVSDNLTFYGTLRLDKAMEMSKSCHIGLSVLMPIDNYLESYSTKIFEYMAIGLPVITSNFELYKNVIEKHETGFCIDPTSSEALARAIFKFVDNPQLISEMGTRGIDVAKRLYNWNYEEEKLIQVYKKLTK